MYLINPNPNTIKISVNKDTRTHETVFTRRQKIHLHSKRQSYKFCDAITSIQRTIVSFKNNNYSSVQIVVVDG